MYTTASGSACSTTWQVAPQQGRTPSNEMARPRPPAGRNSRPCAWGRAAGPPRPRSAESCLDTQVQQRENRGRVISRAGSRGRTTAGRQSTSTVDTGGPADGFTAPARSGLALDASDHQAAGVLLRAARLHACSCPPPTATDAPSGWKANHSRPVPGVGVPVMCGCVSSVCTGTESMAAMTQDDCVTLQGQHERLSTAQQHHEGGGGRSATV